MPNKLTDSEIVKALEICGKGIMFSKHDCKKCPYYTELNCETKCKQNALDLINRLKAENERLRKELNLVSILYQDEQERNSIIKAESYKEVAERLKNEIINDTAYACDITQHSGYYDYQIKIGDIPEYIDNILKELEGDEDAKEKE